LIRSRIILELALLAAVILGALSLPKVLPTYLPVRTTARTESGTWDLLAADQRPRFIESEATILRIPSSFDPRAKHALVVLLSPSADAVGMMQFWTPLAERHQWLILASKTSRNGVDYDQTIPPLIRDLEKIVAEQSVDVRRVVASGISGGGMTSHYLAYQYPARFTAIIVNTGMMDAWMLERREQWVRGKLVVFLASPTDFRYGEMNRDRTALQGLGWSTEWLEFEGGHTMAPVESYELAVRWLERQWADSKNDGGIH
jgi:predicted esterase